MSFFARRELTLEDLRTYEFFLVYHGKGYTASDVAEMPVDDLLWRVSRLKKQLDEENEAKEAELRKAKAKKAPVSRRPPASVRMRR